MEDAIRVRRAIPPSAFPRAVSRDRVLTSRTPPPAQAIKLAKDELVKRDRKNKTRVADALDLVDLLAKATNGTLESPAEVLQAIGAAWQVINASNATAARASRADGKGKPSAHASDAPAADLADAPPHPIPMARGGPPGHRPRRGRLPCTPVHVNHKNVKTALSSMINWSQRNRCESFLPGVKAIKEDVAAKADGPIEPTRRWWTRCAR